MKVLHLFGKLRSTAFHRGEVHVWALHGSYNRVSKSKIVFITSENNNKKSRAIKMTSLLEDLARQL